MASFTTFDSPKGSKSEAPYCILIALGRMDVYFFVSGGDIFKGRLVTFSGAVR